MEANGMMAEVYNISKICDVVCEVFTSRFSVNCSTNSSHVVKATKAIMLCIKSKLSIATSKLTTIK